MPSRDDALSDTPLGRLHPGSDPLQPHPFPSSPVALPVRLRRPMGCGVYSHRRQSQLHPSRCDTLLSWYHRIALLSRSFVPSFKLVHQEGTRLAHFDHVHWISPLWRFLWLDQCRNRTRNERRRWSKFVEMALYP